MPRIFVSYAREDRGFTSDLVRDLERRGFDCWIDRQDIPDGSEWRKEISDAIDACAVFLIVLSSHSIASANVKRELAFAESRGCRIVPIRYSSCVLPPEIELTLGSLQWSDFESERYETAFARLMRTLRPSAPDVSDRDADRRPKLVPWISGAYALSGVYVLFAFALFLLGVRDEGGEVIAFFRNQSSIQLSLTVVNAAVSIVAAIALLRASRMAFLLFVVSWLLLSVNSVLSWQLPAAPDARLTSIVKYAFASYALYYAFSVRRHLEGAGRGSLHQHPSRSSTHVTSV
jgi:hypothetical protein